MGEMNKQTVYQDRNLRSYFGSIGPPTRQTFGFRLGRCIIMNFQKQTMINLFVPRRPQQRWNKSRPGKKKSKGRWWEIGQVGPIKCLDSSDNRKEKEQNEVRFEDQKKQQNEIRVLPKKKQGYGYKDRSPSIKKNLSKLLRVSGAFKHPKYTEVVNNIAFPRPATHQRRAYGNYAFQFCSTQDLSFVPQENMSSPVIAHAPQEKGLAAFGTDFLMGGVSIEHVKLLIQNQKDVRLKAGRLSEPDKRTIADEEGMVSLWRGNMGNVISCYFPTQVDLMRVWFLSLWRGHSP